MALDIILAMDRCQFCCRDAVLYIVSITSVMRNDEAIGIEVGAWRKELKNGVTFC